MSDSVMGYGRAFVVGIIGLFVGVLIAVALTPGITTGINSLTSGATPIVTGTPATLFGNVVLFLALGVMLFAVGFALAFIAHKRGIFAFDYADTIRYRLTNSIKRFVNTVTHSINHSLERLYYN